ncbi:hypothetical protein E3N88_39910 [Mikania micrantha]|uniref:Uncharacterized protein n=1 Tax=Mikania micrantha TaxID=192012 RepID=A0A5N6LL42_9ASTR|nr:hypothetical protein E3N88_39910 [Mikania micrantha]
MLLGSSTPSKSPLESLENSDQWLSLENRLEVSGTVVPKSARSPALSSSSPALACVGLALASSHGRAWVSSTMHGPTLPGCMVVQGLCTVVCGSALPCLALALPVLRLELGCTANATFSMIVRIWGFAQKLLKFHIRLDFLPSKVGVVEVKPLVIEQEKSLRWLISYLIKCGNSMMEVPVSEHHGTLIELIMTPQWWIARSAGNCPR